jgi:hypothetical protein
VEKKPGEMRKHQRRRERKERENNLGGKTKTPPSMSGSSSRDWLSHQQRLKFTDTSGFIVNVFQPLSTPNPH